MAVSISLPTVVDECLLWVTACRTVHSSTLSVPAVVAGCAFLHGGWPAADSLLLLGLMSSVAALLLLTRTRDGCIVCACLALRHGCSSAGTFDSFAGLAVASGQSRCPQHNSDALAACTGRAAWRGSSRAQSIGVTMSMSCRRSCVVSRSAHGGSFVCEHASSVGRLLPLNLFAFTA